MQATDGIKRAHPEAEQRPSHKLHRSNPPAAALLHVPDPPNVDAAAAASNKQTFDTIIPEFKLSEAQRAKVAKMRDEHKATLQNKIAAARGRLLQPPPAAPEEEAGGMEGGEGGGLARRPEDWKYIYQKQLAQERQSHG